MTQQALRSTLEAMAALPGVDSCALVEIDAGMVWHHAGQTDGVLTFAEAASDYWRLSGRLAEHFEVLGDLRASVMMHARGRITLLPCGNGMLLVALTRAKSGLDWAQWQDKARQLAQLVDRL